MHAQVQFARIATPAPERDHDSASLHVQPPTQGSLPPEQLETLCRILHGHTPRMMACWLAVWIGWGELNGSSVILSTSLDRPPPPPQPAPEHRQLDLRAAQFDLPGRQYYLFNGMLDDALRVGHWPTRDWFLPRSSNLFWPDDRRWCVASEIDFDSTLVAGSPQLIDDILHANDLEAWRVGPHDCLASDGDTVNQP